jgi:hypothetical protein
MQLRIRFMRDGIIMTGALLLTAAWAVAGAHTWRVNEVFTNASGTIQFIELRESLGGAGEIGVNGHNITSVSRAYTIPAPALTPPVSFKTLLFATPAAAALPGMPTPNYIFPAGSVPFFSINGDSISYTPFDTFTFSGALLPKDGVHSLNRNLSVGCNSPRNFAGQTGSINVGCTVPGDVNGSGALDGADIAGFVRVILGAPAVGDNAACAEYCMGSVALNIAALVNDLLN